MDSRWAHIKPNREAKLPACSTAGGSRGGGRSGRNSTGAGVERGGAMHPASRHVAIDHRGGGGQLYLNSRGAHIEPNCKAKSPACSTAGDSRGGGCSGRNSTGAGVERDGATYPTPRHAAIDRRVGGRQSCWDSRGAHIELNREAKSPACSTVGGSRGGGAVVAIQRGLASNATKRRIPLRAMQPLTTRRGVINFIEIQGGRTSDTTAKQSPPPAPQWVVVEGGLQWTRFDRGWR